MKHRTILWLVFAVVSVAGVAAWYVGRPMPVTVVHPLRKDFTTTVALEGTVRPPASETIYCRLYHRRVTRVFVKPGQVVKYGHSLLELEDAEAKGDIARAEARESWARKTEQTERLAAERRRTARFNQSKAVAESAWARKKKALVDLAMARQGGSADEIAAAEKAVQLARSALLWTSGARYHLLLPDGNQAIRQREAIKAINSAYDQVEAAKRRLAATTRIGGEACLVTKVLVRPGQEVAKNQPLVEIARTGSISVDVPLPAGLRKGRTIEGKTFEQLLYPSYARGSSSFFTAAVPGGDALVTVASLPGRELHGRVQGASWDRNGREAADVVLNDAPFLLRPGTVAHVKFITGRYRRALIVPRAAIVGTPSSAFALVVRDGRAVRQPVKVDGWSLPEVVVQEGLGDGDIVVKQPGGVKAGQRVRPIETR